MPSSSSLTQSDVPLTIVVGAVVRQLRDGSPGEPFRRRGFDRARRRRCGPSGENFANISDDSGASPPSLRSDARVAVEQPVVAARVLAPDFPRVREDQHALPVGRPRVAVDRQRSGRARAASAAPHRPAPRGAGRGVVADERDVIPVGRSMTPYDGPPSSQTAGPKVCSAL